ncbi:hypothetical protein D3C85_993820 [compost metagenome]
MREAAIVLALAGCATSGTKITQGQLNQVVSGQTTHSDLVRLFGPPTSEVYSSDGTQVMGWGYAHVGFAGIGTEIQGVSMIIGPDGTVSGYTRTGSAPATGLATRSGTGRSWGSNTSTHGGITDGLSHPHPPRRRTNQAEHRPWRRHRSAA